jgi:hypothetical protein
MRNYAPFFRKNYATMVMLFWFLFFPSKSAPPVLTHSLSFTFPSRPWPAAPVSIAHTKQPAAAATGAGNVKGTRGKREEESESVLVFRSFHTN